MSWRFPRRIFRDGRAVDVDDANEGVYEFGSDSGSITEQNCDEDIWGTTEANRISYVEKDAPGLTFWESTSYEAAGTTAIEQGGSWLVLDSVEVTCGPAHLRCFGRLWVHPLGGSAFGQTIIRVNGTPVYAAQGSWAGEPCSCWAFPEVPEGTHVVELCVLLTSATGVSRGNGLLTVMAMEK